MKVVVFNIFLLFSAYLSAQNQWYFGDYAGIDFSSGTPVVTNDGEFQYNEGCSSINDCNGNLLFYSDGEKVWDKNHDVMPNGLGLSGHYSSTQGCLIVPVPDDPDIFFIFTPDAKENGYNRGLTYSMVNMNLNNGLGDVILKNYTLHSSCSEKLCAAMHSNKKDTWIIWHGINSDTMYSVLITDAGLGTNINAQSIGPSISGVQGIGQMKASPTGDKIAFVNLTPEIAVIMDFDNTAGTFSNQILIPSSYFPQSGLYGIEFSPDGNKLYISNHNIDYIFSSGSLYQFDLSTGNPTSILNSAFELGNNLAGTDIRGMQLAPDGKIYVSRSLGQHLGVINNPNDPGMLANYVDEGLYLGGALAYWGLPNFVSGKKIKPKGYELSADFNTDSIGCADDVLFVQNLSSGNIAKYEWYVNGEYISGGLDVWHSIEKEGNYTIKLHINNQCAADSLTKQIEISDCSCEKNLFVPTAFSPNNDGQNDVLFVHANHFELLSFRVYDRYGTSIFSTTDLTKGWDGKILGKPAESSIYVYHLTGTCTDTGKPIQKHGNITLTK